jgi:hypothetical protein
MHISTGKHITVEKRNQGILYLLIYEQADRRSNIFKYCFYCKLIHIIVNFSFIKLDFHRKNFVIIYLIK